MNYQYRIREDNCCNKLEMEIKVVVMLNFKNKNSKYI